MLHLASLEAPEFDYQIKLSVALISECFHLICLSPFFTEVAFTDLFELFV